MVVFDINERILEAYIGEYASGKSEVAINRALYLLKKGYKPVTLVDLDLVEPFYTLRPLKKELEENGLEIIAWETKETLGLGEAGNIIKPEMRWSLKKEGSVILDIGYGVEGAKKLNLVEDAYSKGLKIYVVTNIARPMTGDVSEIVDYIKKLGLVHGLINNSHLGDDTDIEIVQSGAKIVTEAARQLHLPVIWSTVEKSIAEKIGKKDVMDNDIFPIERRMNRAFW